MNSPSTRAALFVLLSVASASAQVDLSRAGELIRREWSTQDLFYSAVVPAAISAVVMLSLRWAMKPDIVRSDG